MTDYLITAGLLAATGASGILGYYYSKAKKKVKPPTEFESFDEALNAIKVYIVEQIKEEPFITNLTEDELQRLEERRNQRKNALKMAPNGVREAKLIVKAMIRTWVTENLTMGKIREFLGIDEQSEPSHNAMFEILMYRFQQEYGMNAFNIWMDKYHFDAPKPAVGIARPGAEAYYITPAEFESSYFTEDIVLGDDEAIDVLVTLFYEQYMGWGPIDTIADMNINGYNFGVSGSLIGNAAPGKRKNPDAVSEATNSFWVYFRSHYIHLQFLDFGNLEEIRRVSQLMIRWGNPGPLTTKSGYKVNTMHDKSRILAIRPDAGESWGVFVRKFSLDIKSPEDMIIKKGVTGGEIAAKLVEILMNAQLTIAITGRQGSGKTTMMKAVMGYLPADWNIRVLEMAPELYLRETYPDREIYSVQETQTLSMEELQDAFKKSDATVTVIGEVATDPVAARLIQLAMTGSLMTIFSHHANTAKDLVLTVRNSLVNAGGFSNMATAEKQVTDVLKINIHLGFEDGKRFIKRITEIKQFDEGLPYPEYNAADPDQSRYNLQKEYYYRQTDRVSFSTHDLLTYNKETDTYEIGEMFSDYLYNRICETLTKKDREEFKKFIAYYWQGKSIDGYNGVKLVAEDEKTAEIKDHMIYNVDDAISFMQDNGLADYTLNADALPSLT